jgi:hypothetical protein
MSAETARHIVCLAILLALGVTDVPVTVAGPAELAKTFMTDNRFGDAAIEFRRVALEEKDALARGGCYWAAAYSYWRNEKAALANKMLDRAEDETPALRTESLLLRGELELWEARIDQARFYFESVAEAKVSPDAKSFANRRLAGIAILTRDLPAAKTRIRISDSDPSNELAAIEHYARGTDKSPSLGGILGVVPGLGYAYSGEYANATRCLILNSLFIFGMANTANHEQWGAFSVITFFELTWYTGSIYGGIDAAHRFNENRLANCIRAVESGAELRPDVNRLPLVSLTFPFK